MLDELKKYGTANLLKDLLYSVIGSALVGISLSVFAIPNDIAPGGVSGLATALAHISPIRVSLWNIILNVPLLLFAWRLLGARTIIFTIISTALMSLFIEVGMLIPPYSGDSLLAALCAGVVCGVGIGLLMLRGISTGGTDLLALILRKPFPNIANGNLLMIIDASVVLFAVCVFRDMDVALYSFVTIFSCSKLIDALAQGVDYAKVIYTITDNGKRVSDMVAAQTDRGTTIVPATGGYTGQGKDIVIIVTRRNMLSQTLRAIKAADPKAFTFVTDSTEVHGEGFKIDSI